MKSMMLVLALFAGQMMTLQDKPVVHLKPHKNAIEVNFNGSMLVLINSPATIYLPPAPPPPNAAGTRWSIDVKNMGPLAVTVAHQPGFNQPVAVNQTIHIYSNGKSYLLTH